MNTSQGIARGERRELTTVELETVLPQLDNIGDAAQNDVAAGGVMGKLRELIMNTELKTSLRANKCRFIAARKSRRATSGSS